MNTRLAARLDEAASLWFDWMAPMAGQVVALVCVLAVLSWLLRGRSARLRYALWLLVPLRLALPPTLALATGWSWWLLPQAAAPVPAVVERTETAIAAPTQPERSIIDVPQLPGAPLRDMAIPVARKVDSAPSTFEREATPVPASASNWRRGLLLAWGAIASLLLARLGLGILVARRLVAAARPVGDGPLRTDIQRWRRELGIRRPVGMRILPGSGVPMVVGVFRPCIVLPNAIESQLDNDELQSVLVHELHHVARRDAVVNLVQAVLGALYFFHPAVWWANSRLTRLREDACDEATVATLRGRRRAYGSGMVKIADMLVGPPPRVALGVAESGHQVTRRLKRVLDPRLPFGSKLRWPARLFLLLLAAVLLPAAARPARPTDESSGSQGAAQHATDSLKPDALARIDATSDAAMQPAKAARTSATVDKAGDAAAKGADKIVHVHGRVIGPDGKPVAGAEITVWWYFGFSGFYKDWRPPTNASPKPRFGATSRADGRFDFKFAQSEIDENPNSFWDPRWRFGMQVVAAADGYGPAWASLEGTNNQVERTLKLVPDDRPIQLRVRNLEGRPISGARIRVERVTVHGDEQNSLWQTTWAGLSKNLKSDAAGRMTLRGVGRGRTAVLHIDGPAIEHKVLFVEIPPIEKQEPMEAVQVEVLAGPGKPIEGTIRAKDTGRPLAGVVIWGEEGHYHRHVQAITDGQGRYRLEGLPKAREYSLTINPPRDLSYLPTRRIIADTLGLRPLATDFSLRRGVPVRCRFIDKVTRQTVRPGDLRYGPLKTNPYYSEVDTVGVTPSPEYHVYYVPDSDGIYRFVAWPGLGVLGAMPQNVIQKYLPTPIDPVDRRKAGGDPQLDFWSMLCGVRVIEPHEGESQLDLVIELDPGRTLRGWLLGPDSNPVSGAQAYGLNFNAENSRRIDYGPEEERQTLQADAFVVRRVEPHVRRTLSFIHPGRKLVGQLVLNSEEQEPLRVRMQSWGEAGGRIVDAQGQPLKDVRVYVRYPNLPAPGFPPLTKDFKTNADGRFHIDGLIPGIEPQLTLKGKSESESLSAGDSLKKLVVKPGQLTDLGEIKVQVSRAITRQ